MFRPGPLTFAHDRQARAVDDHVKARAGRDSIKPDVKVLAAPGERGVVGRVELEAQHPEERAHEPLGLTDGQVEEKPERQYRFDGDIRVLLLPAARADARGRVLAPVAVDQSPSALRS